MKRLFFLSIFAFAAFTRMLHAQDAIILTHGAFAASNTWMLPGSAFYKNVELATKNTADIYPYYWEQPFGGLFDIEKINAAKELATLVIMLKASGYDKISIIAHSYGGHVTALASQLLNANKPSIEVVDTTQQPSARIATDALIYSNDNEQSFNQNFCNAQQQIAQTSSLLKTFDALPTATRTEQDGQNYYINIVYTLATPTDPVEFPIDTTTVQYIINGWSENDLVQELVSGQKITINPSRAINLEFFIPENEQDTEGFWNIMLDFINWLLGYEQEASPDHIEMRSSIIGRWLPKVPFELQAQGINGFENFTFEKDGILTFDQNPELPPFYTKSE